MYALSKLFGMLWGEKSSILCNCLPACCLIAYKSSQNGLWFLFYWNFITIVYFQVLNLIQLHSNRLFLTPLFSFWVEIHFSVRIFFFCNEIYVLFLFCFIFYVKFFLAKWTLWLEHYATLVSLINQEQKKHLN